ncbi:MAG: hypothetical protein A2Y31_04540 [Spirochaetes bacterium GWC2_52_13]|nr:MAG: hypothetical protein A2Y31_04540 [Spirochaetes bacterium GWC2_52_13]HCG62667.1 hypothetical protein [Sphaerochaeta sp.]
MAHEPAAGQDTFHIPLELKTVVKSLRMKIWVLLGIAVLSATVGVGAALFLGTREYEATTVLYYQPIESYVSDSFRIYQSVGSGTELTYDQGAGLLQTSSSSDLNDHVNMVKIVPNLEALRKDLELELTLEELGAAISVDTAYDSNLIFISAKSESPTQAARIANTIRTIFLENSNRMIDQDIQAKLSDLNLQYDSTIEELQLAKEEFSAFVRTHGIRELGTEATQYTSELLSLESNLEQNRAMIESAKAKISRIEREIESRKLLSVEQNEQLASTLASPNLSVDEANNRIRLLQQKIEAFQSARLDPIEEERLRTILAIAENGYVRGTVDRTEYETARYNYDRFLAEKTPSVELIEAQRQLDLLLSAPLATSATIQTDSTYLQSLQLRLLESELQLIEAESAYARDNSRYMELKDRYVDLPLIAQEYARISGRVASLEAVAQGLGKVLNQYSMIASQEHSDFYVISDAVEPLFPRESNRRMIAAGATVVMFLLGFTILLVTIALDLRIKSAGDAKQKLQMPILQTFGYVRNKRHLMPSEQGESVHIEEYRILSRPLRAAYPHKGATFLVTSASDGEGKTTTAINLATVFGRQDEHVLLIDAQIRKSKEESPFNEFLIDDDGGAGNGLGEYLSYRVFDSHQIISSTKLSGVDMIVRKGEAVIPDLLQSARMRELMDELKQMYSVIIIEGPPIQDCVDSDILSSYADSILFVTASDMLRPDRIQMAIKRMQNTPATLEGIILTKVRPIYMD